jgi:hypothetical protein
MENHDWDNDLRFTDDWLQANWELLVERQLLKREGYLNTFCMFYECDRYTQKDAKVTHEIICRSKNNGCLIDGGTGKIIPVGTRLVFYVFLKKMDVSYGLYPPFDTAGVFSRDGKKRSLYLVPVDDVEFFMEEVLSDS